MSKHPELQLSPDLSLPAEAVTETEAFLKPGR